MEQKYHKTTNINCLMSMRRNKPVIFSKILPEFSISEENVQPDRTV